MELLISIGMGIIFSTIIGIYLYLYSFYTKKCNIKALKEMYKHYQKEKDIVVKAYDSIEEKGDIVANYAYSQIKEFDKKMQEILDEITKYYTLKETN